MSKKPKKDAAKPAAKTLPKAKVPSAKSAPSQLAWTQHGKTQWLAPDPDGDLSVAGGRITMATNTWKNGPGADPSYSCYRDGKYLGTDPTLEAAMRRVQYREESATVLRDTAAGDVPAFLALAPDERRSARIKAGQAAPPRVERVVAPVATAPADAAVKAAQTRAQLQDKSAPAPQRIGRGRPPGTAVIRVISRANPRKPGTGQYARYDTIILHDGKTVAQYTAAQGDMQALKYAVDGGHAKLEE